MRNEQLKQQLSLTLTAASSHSQLYVAEKPIRAFDQNDCLQWSTQFILQRNKTDFVLSREILAELIAVVCCAYELATNHQIINGKPRLPHIFALIMLMSAEDYGQLLQVETGEGKTAIIAMFSVMKVLMGETVDILTSSPLLAVRDAKANKIFFDIFHIIADHNHNGSEQYFSGFKSCYDAQIVYGDNQFQYDFLHHEYLQHNTRGLRQPKVIVTDEADYELVNGLSKMSTLASPKTMMEYLKLIIVPTWFETLRLNTDDQINDSTVLAQSVHQYLLHLLATLESQHKIPNHLISYAKAQSKYWAKSAASAILVYRNNIHYVVTDDHNIAPVEFDGNGVTLLNSQWDDALQLFLHIKEGCPLSTEILTTNFESNVHFFRRYGRIFGLSGTLPKACKELLKNIYHVETDAIPAFHKKQLTHDPDILAANHQEWLAAIIEKVRFEINVKKRAALIICENIQEADFIYHVLEEKNIGNRYLLKRSDKSVCLPSILECGDIIVSTSLSGRGTHFEISDELEANGGLQVQIVSLLDTETADIQAFGRAARNGKKGGGQRILNRESVEKKLKSNSAEYHADTIDNILACRNKIECKKLEYIQFSDLRIIEFKDGLFQRFSELMHQLRKISPAYCRLQDVEEQWGKWLKKISHTLHDAQISGEPFEFEKITEEFEECLKQWEYNFRHKILKNPAHWIQYAQFCTLNNEEKIEAYSNAIALDPYFSIQAYYCRAFLHIQARTPNYKIIAAQDLQITKQRIDSIILLQWEKILAELDSNDYQNTPLYQQIYLTIQVWSLQANYIAQLIQLIQSTPNDIKILETKSLSKFFEERNAPEEILHEFNRIGLTDIYFIQEEIKPKKKKKGSWLTNICTTVFGGLQIALGIVLCEIPVFAPFAKALIASGSHDIALGLTNALNGNKMSWKDYRDSMPNRLKSAGIAVGCHFVNLALPASANAESTTRLSFSEKMSYQLRYSVLHTGLTHATSMVICKPLMRNLKGEIQSHVRHKLQYLFNRIEFIAILNRILSYDPNLIIQLEQMAHEIISTHRNPYSNVSVDIASGIISHVLPLFDAVKIADSTAKAFRMCDKFCDFYYHRIQVFLQTLSFNHFITLQDCVEAREILFQHVCGLLTKALTNHWEQNVITPLVHRITPIDQTVRAIIDKMDEEPKPTKKQDENKNDSETKMMTLSDGPHKITVPQNKGGHTEKKHQRTKQQNPTNERTTPALDLRFYDPEYMNRLLLNHAYEMAKRSDDACYAVQTKLTSVEYAAEQVVAYGAAVPTGVINAFISIGKFIADVADSPIVHAKKLGVFIADMGVVTAFGGSPNPYAFTHAENAEHFEQMQQYMPKFVHDAKIRMGKRVDHRIIQPAIHFMNSDGPERLEMLVQLFATRKIVGKICGLVAEEVRQMSFRAPPIRVYDSARKKYIWVEERSAIDVTLKMIGAPKPVTKGKLTAIAPTQKLAITAGKKIVPGTGLAEQSLDNAAVRKWYLLQLSKIPDQIDSTASQRKQGLQSVTLRNQIKMQARALMKDQEAAKKLPHPISLGDLHKKAIEKNLLGEFWIFLYEGAQKSNPTVNISLGLTSTPGNSLFSKRHLTIEEIANRIALKNPALSALEFKADNALPVSSKSIGASKVPTLSDFCVQLNLPQTGPLAFKAKVDSNGNSIIEKNQYGCIIDLYGNLWKYSPGHSSLGNYIPGHWDVIVSETTHKKLQEYNESVERHNKKYPHDQKGLFIFRKNKYGIGHYVNVVAENETNLKYFTGPGFPHH